MELSDFAAEWCSRLDHGVCIHTVSVIQTDGRPRTVVTVLSADGEVAEGEFYDVVVGHGDCPHTVRVTGVLQRVGRGGEQSFAGR